MIPEGAVRLRSAGWKRKGREIVVVLGDAQSEKVNHRLLKKEGRIGDLAVCLAVERGIMKKVIGRVLGKKWRRCWLVGRWRRVKKSEQN